MDTVLKVGVLREGAKIILAQGDEVIEYLALNDIFIQFEEGAAQLKKIKLIGKDQKPPTHLHLVKS